MTSPISPISGFSPVSGLQAVTGVGSTDAISGTDRATAAQGAHESFASMLSRGLESVQSAQGKADDLAVQAAQGTLTDPAQYTMAANEAQLGMQLTLAVRNKAVEAFQEIMRMQA
ncbi:flagellar hook-basal body complex protein FliE [Actinoplanes bogorensis]|uniref:Flagellar hook-basal body complex protein FliE n=1 Tax=Paractinoplanes bogorensis TaxID=1610840 RepID=A0ABS5YHZ7_9ACTN|nr:flagellar hook-basal body complex protein FliE [Actinoplanes bogorensis]MBU2663099.1 flagellar hook-basal body complex protein FliE [Actinoplanes bogorensis]